MSRWDAGRRSAEVVKDAVGDGNVALASEDQLPAPATELTPEDGRADAGQQTSTDSGRIFFNFKVLAVTIHVDFDAEGAQSVLVDAGKVAQNVRVRRAEMLNATPGLFNAFTDGVHHILLFAQTCLKLNQAEAVAQDLCVLAGGMLAHGSTQGLEAFAQAIQVAVDIKGIAGVRLEKGLDGGFQRLLLALALGRGLMDQAGSLEYASQGEGLVAQAGAHAVCPCMGMDPPGEPVLSMKVRSMTPPPRQTSP